LGKGIHLQNLERKRGVSTSEVSRKGAREFNHTVFGTGRNQTGTKDSSYMGEMVQKGKKKRPISRNSSECEVNRPKVGRKKRAKRSEGDRHCKIEAKTIEKGGTGTNSLKGGVIFPNIKLT